MMTRTTSGLRRSNGRDGPLELVRLSKDGIMNPLVFGLSRIIIPPLERPNDDLVVHTTQFKMGVVMHAPAVVDAYLLDPKVMARVARIERVHLSEMNPRNMIHQDLLQLMTSYPGADSEEHADVVRTIWIGRPDLRDELDPTTIHPFHDREIAQSGRSPLGFQVKVDHERHKSLISLTSD